MSKKLSRLTKLRAEELSRKNALEEIDRLDAIGQESEIKGAKWAKEDFREKEKAEDDFKDQSYQVLSDLKKDKKKYGRFLVGLIHRFIQAEAIHQRYTIIVDLTDKGVMAQIEGTNLYAAFTPSGIDKYDFMACKTLAVKIGNTVAHLEGYRQESNGVLLPDELDKKKIK